MLTILLSELQQGQKFNLAYSNNAPVTTAVDEVKVIADVGGRVIFRDPQTPLLKDSCANMSRHLRRLGLTMHRDE